MTRRISLLFVIFLTLFAAACSPEAKKKKALDGGNKYFEKGQYKQARLMYLNAIKVDPRFGEAYYKLALTNLRLGSYGEALGNLQRTVELQPENLDALSKLSDIYINAYASNPVKFKNFMNDIKDLESRLEKRGKGSYEELRLRGFIAMADGKAEEGLQFFREADKKKPDQQVLQLTIARTMLALKQLDETKAYLRTVLAKDKSAGAFYDLLYGITMMENNPDEGEKVLLERGQNNPKDSANRLRLAASTRRPSMARCQAWSLSKCAAPSLASARATTSARSSAPRGSRRHRVDRERSGAFTSKNGFSVVAPISTSRPSSTEGSRASCWDRLKRWTSSRKRMVPRPCSPSRRRAPSTTSRTSLTPAVTAERGTNCLAVAVATTEASVVLPVPMPPVTTVIPPA